MRIAMVGDFPRKVDEMGGGVEAVTTYLANALQQIKGIEVEAVTLDRWGGAARSEQQRDVRVHFVPLSRLPSRLSNRQNARAMASVIRKLKPDLVHAHIANQYAHAAKQTTLPWVLTAHGIRHLEMSLRPGIINRWRTLVVNREEHALMRAANNLISISPFIEEVFGTELNAEVTLIDNPVDGSFFEGQRRPETGRILYVGRLIPRKDILTLLRAFAQVRKRIPSASLRLAGAGIIGLEPTGYPAELASFLDSHELSDHVHFLGQLDDAALQDEYRRSAVMAVSSVLETAPMVILQAMAASVPVVSTDAGGIRHLVEHAESGFVVPIGDDAGLADGLSQILADDSLANRMAMRSKAIAEERFRASVVAAKTAEVYQRVVTGP